MADAAQKWASEWFHGTKSKPMLVLVGDPNCAKTHTARALYRFCRAAGIAAYEKRGMPAVSVPSPRFMRWPELFHGNPSWADAALEDAFSADPLFIDDIGAEHDPSRIGVSFLCQILSRREWEHTLVTTNIQPEAWTERFDARVADRLMRYSNVIDLTGVESYALVQ